jgi:chemotaxis protein MotB
MNRRATRAKVSHERWLVSYADFITLLFAFFVVLYAFSKADQKKQAQVSVAIDSALQSLSVASAITKTGSNETGIPRSTGTPENNAVQRSSSTQVQTDLEHIRRDLQQRLSLQIAKGTVSIELGHDGLVISLREAGFFDSGDAIPRPETTSTLRAIAESLTKTPYDVRVEGHTDNVPIHNSDFDSNWELSSARATRITRLLVEMHMIAPSQLSAAGYAEYHPVAANNTAEGRAENRRVDLVVMPRAFLDIDSQFNTGNGPSAQ